jgi:hypothetical protein
LVTSVSASGRSKSLPGIDLALGQKIDQVLSGTGARGSVRRARGLRDEEHLPIKLDTMGTPTEPVIAPGRVLSEWLA